MAFLENYHFSRRFNKCAVTEMPFIDGQQIWTAIFPMPNEAGYLRKDFSEEGWLSRSEEDQFPFSSWRAKWKKTEKREDDTPLEKETAETLLSRLAIADIPETNNTRYILALMLERSRLLVEIESKEITEGILRVYRHKKTQEIYFIKDPNLPLDQIAALQAEVVEMLEV